MNMAPMALHGLPKRLVDDHLIEPQDLQVATTSAKTAKLSLVQYLCEKKLVSDTAIANSAAKEFGIPIYSLEHHNNDHIPKDIIDTKLLKKHQVMPLVQRGNRLFVAVADPTNHRALNEIQFQTGIAVEPVLALYSSITKALEKWLETNADQDIGEVLGTIDDMHLDDLDMEAIDDDDKDSSESNGEDEAPIVRFINKMLIDAIKLGASDIHFEPYEKSYRVRFRVDGILREMAKPPANLAQRLAARLKVMSRMDISERRIPQDGRVKLKLSKNKSIDFRVNTLPLQFGEKIVLRILDASSAKLGIDALGYEDDQKTLYMDALARPQGMILVTGPTGSGKTVSLYTGLNILNTAERNISTAEDPIEINMEGINQTQINMRVGLSFAEALRSFLRQDPDVVMVGEIRDLETAEIAIKAAQTGHLVMSTLHTNSAPETLTRLLNMGVPSFNVATSVNLIIAQRLGRKLCPQCRIAFDDIPDKILKDEGFEEIGIAREEFTIFKAGDCPSCTNGYKGRVGVYETLKISPAISKIIMEGGSSLDILETALQEGFKTLRVSALRKAARGLISIEEANRITKD
ncbi:MAG: Type II secretion system protein E [SAR92 bacterium MED-G29]|jgi:type IV pilus assembly protein PilB|nr:MAG: Type II secretion system protein E [SAR92 bacterium MED-G29]|tara:strand:- start:162 stop:1892 length:1731 start_codon:yes stop_codon:yes gene_type:complete